MEGKKAFSLCLMILTLGWLFVILSFSSPPGIFHSFNGILPFATADPVHTPRLFALSVVLLVTVVAMLFSRDHRISLSVMQQFFLLLLFMALLLKTVSFFYAPNTAEVWNAIAKALLFTLLFIILSLLFNLQQGIFLRWFVLVMTITAVVMLAAGLFQFFENSISERFSHASSYKLTALMAHRNLFAQVLLLAVPVLFLKIFSTKRFFRIGYIFLLLLTLFFLLITYSRAVWLAGGVAGAATLLMVLFHLSENKRSMLKVVVGVIVLISITAFLTFFIHKMNREHVLAKQFHVISNAGYGSSLERKILWDVSLQMINSHKLTGVGAGNWGVAVMKHDVTSIRENDAGRTFFQRAHNDYLQQGAEGGYPGMIIFLALFVVAGYAILKTVNRKNQCCSIGEKGVILFVYFAVVIISIFSFPYERPLLQMIFMAFFAGVVSLGKFWVSFKQVRLFKIRSIMMIVLVPLLLLVCFFAKKLNSEIMTYRMYGARAQKDFVAQEKLAKAAISFNHQLDKTSTPIAWYAGEACVNQHDYINAYRWYALAYHHNQYHPYVLNNYAWILWFFQKEEEAKKYFKQVILFNPKFDEARLNYISLCFEEGDLYEAVHHLQMVDTLCRNEKYRIAVELILPAVAKRTRQGIEDPRIETAIQRIESDENWLKKVFRQSINDKNPYTKQLLTEAVYLIHVVDKDISTSEALHLKRKYTIELPNL